jgi:hypothetical protein
MTLRRTLTTAIVIAVLAGILLGGLALTGTGSVLSKAVPSQLRGDDGESEPDENENEAPERTSGTSPSDDSSRANDEADDREPSEGGADETERGNEP